MTILIKSWREGIVVGKKGWVGYGVVTKCLKTLENSRTVTKQEIITIKFYQLHGPLRASQDPSERFKTPFYGVFLFLRFKESSERALGWLQIA